MRTRLGNGQEMFGGTVRGKWETTGDKIEI